LQLANHGGGINNHPMNIHNLVSFSGLFALMVIGWAFSKNRWRMNFRCIIFGVAIQLALAGIVFHAPGSRAAFSWLNDFVVTVLSAAQAGQRFLFGPLAEADNTGGFVLAMQALPMIVFFAALMGLLYYVGLMPLILRTFACVFAKLMGTSGAESLCASSNIFVGIESVTTVRPFLAGMTRSEYCTIITAGMATVASSTLAVYVGFLHEVFDGIAGHLISASILSAPAAIVMSKIVYPEDGKPVTLGRSVAAEIEKDSGAIEAIVSGAMAGVKLIVGICALLIAFLGMIALVDLALAWAGGPFGIELSLARILGYVFRPLMLMVGVPWADSEIAGQMVGQRLVATEIPPYLQLAKAMADGSFSHPRTAVVVAYCLCGFAHVASLAIFVGGTVALAPNRRKDLAEVGPRALLAANLACLMTGAAAGTFFAG